MCLAQTAEVFNARAGPASRSAWPSSAAASGSTRRWSTALRVVPQRRAVLGLAARAGRVRGGAARAACSTADEDRLDRIAEAFADVIDAKSPWTHRALGRACARSRPGSARCSASTTGAARARARGATARHRQALDLEPDPRQAGPADRGRAARFREHRAPDRADPRPVPGFDGLARARRARTTSGSTATVTRAAWPPRS